MVDDHQDETGIALGIDFGTNNISSSLWNSRERKFEIILNDQCDKITPAYITFGQDSNIIGKAAKDDALSLPENCISIVKRFIGRKVTDQQLNHDFTYISYNIQGVEETESLIVKIKEKEYTFEDIAALFFKQLIKSTEDTFKEKVKVFVFTIPSSFTNAQKQALKSAAKKSKIDKIHMITDTTATALYYDQMNKLGPEENILVCDFGGGSFDVSVINIKNHVFKVIAVSGDNHFGGEDLDAAIYDYCIGKFQESGGTDISNDFAAKKLLKTQCEKVKVTLSNKKTGKINIDKLDGVTNLSLQFTRELFDEICSNHFNLITKHLNIVMKECKLQKGQLNRILFVGGCTSIPKVQDIFKKYFDNTKYITIMDNNDCLSCGAAIWAEKLKKNDTFKHRKINEIVPLSLGIRIEGDLMSVLIPRGTKIPIKVVKNYISTQDHQNRIKFEIYEGERKFVKDNILVGKLVLTGFQKMQRGKVKVDVLFSIDEDGLLTVTTTEVAAQIKNSVVTNENGNVSSEKVQRYLKEAEENKEKDSQEEERIKARLKLYDKIHEVIHSCGDDEEMKKTADSYQTWLKRSPYATKHDYEVKQNDLLGTFRKSTMPAGTIIRDDSRKNTMKGEKKTEENAKKEKEEKVEKAASQ